MGKNSTTTGSRYKKLALKIKIFLATTFYLEIVEIVSYDFTGMCLVDDEPFLSLCPSKKGPYRSSANVR